MHRIFLSIALALYMGCTAFAQDIAGDWLGTFKIGPQEFHMLLHITKGNDGGITAKLDVIEINTKGVPVSSISLQDSKLSFTVDTSQAKYEGKVDGNATIIQGTWSEPDKAFPMDFKRQTAASDAVIARAGQILDLLFQDKYTDLFAAFSPQLQAVLTEDRMRTDIRGILPALGAVKKRLNAKVYTESDLQVVIIPVQFEKGALDFSITLNSSREVVHLYMRPGTDNTVRRRPQNPVKPYPYREEEVLYENKASGLKLGATLTIPAGKGPFPAVVLITGSGTQDRDETIMSHKPFLVLADHLTKKGIIVLRVDDRGAGKSGGGSATDTSADFATDVEAGMAFLKTQTEVDPHKIGLIGHSEGGIIAPMVAARNPDAAFIVMMAGTGVPGDGILVEQVRLVAEAMGASPSQVEKNVAAQRETMAIVKQEKNTEAMKTKLREKLGKMMPELQVNDAIKTVEVPWFRFFLEYDPATNLNKVRCPVLAINGEKDTQVSPKQNLPAIQKALETGGNRKFVIKELPGLNHLFQNAKTGSPSEYIEIEETMSPVALETISGWILKQ
jgi:pimeloyl-ACP methyl ester carboxylesterase